MQALQLKPQITVLFRSPFLLAIGLAMLGGYVVLSKVFFRAPLKGVSISLACYVASLVLSRA